MFSWISHVVTKYTWEFKLIYEYIYRILLVASPFPANPQIFTSTNNRLAFVGNIRGIEGKEEDTQ